MSDKKVQLTKKIITVTIHALIWILVLYFPYLLNWEWNDVSRPPVFIVPKVITNVLMVGLFYFNSYYLIPKIYNTKGVFIYVLCILLTIFLMIGLTVFVHYLFPHNHLQTVQHTVNMGHRQRPHFFYGGKYVRVFISCLIIMAVSFTYKTILDNVRKERDTKVRENEHIKMELSFLRSQVSPHFMFNVLNSTVALARKKSDKLEAVLIELAGLMRYMLYKLDDAKVELEKEVEYIDSYINLQKLRFADNLKLNVQLPTSLSNKFIEPMLLIPLIENAFKHGVGMFPAEINIVLKETGSEIVLNVSNRFDRAGAEKKDDDSGIGLSNLKRRLELLYPKKHSFSTSRKDDIFIAELKIQLS